MTNLEFILKNASPADFTHLFFEGIGSFADGTELYAKTRKIFWTWIPDSFDPAYAVDYFNTWLSLPYNEEEWAEGVDDIEILDLDKIEEYIDDCDGSYDSDEECDF